MAPLAGAEKAAIEAFMQSKRGAKVLRSAVSAPLAAYFVANGTTLGELPTARPPDPTKVEDWAAEWKDYASAAGINDSADVKNVGRWVMEQDAAASVGTRSGRVAAVADALARKGLHVDRAAEMAISSALAAADKGDVAAQCRAFEVIWHIYTGQSPGEAERAEFSEKRAACNAEDGVDPTVDLRQFSAYYKQMKNTTVPTLERALLSKTEDQFRTYYSA